MTHSSARAAALLCANNVTDPSKPATPLPQATLPNAVTATRTLDDLYYLNNHSYPVPCFLLLPFLSLSLSIFVSFISLLRCCFIALSCSLQLWVGSTNKANRLVLFLCTIRYEQYDVSLQRTSLFI